MYGERSCKSITVMYVCEIISDIVRMMGMAVGTLCTCVR
jgi:hypothetical protein